jgi:hypothetical protein
MVSGLGLELRQWGDLVVPQMARPALTLGSLRRRVLGGAIQGTISEQPVNIQGAFREHSGEIQGTFTKRSVIKE